jgi:hypothetical protein
MPENISNKMSKNILNKMPEDMPIKKYINIIV